MSLTSARQARWALPLLLVGAVVGGTQLTSSASAAAPDLPALSAQQLLARAGGSRVQAFSGTVFIHTDLGLPALPQQGSVDWSALVSGTHTLRVAADGAQQQRVDLVDDLSQASIVHDGSQVWTWSSATRKVTRTTLPVGSEQSRLADGRLGHKTPAQDVPLTPDQAAQQALAAVTPTTQVSVGRTARVAGRSAYVLKLAPRDGRSLVGAVRIYVDARTSMVLRTTVAARNGGEPAVDVGFSSLRLAAPASSTFRFTPPPGSQVRDLPWKAVESTPPSKDGAASPVRTHGAGWSTVVESDALPVLAGAQVGASGKSEQSSANEALLRAASPVRGSFGTGRMLNTRLLTVLQTDDGRVFAGSVTTQELLRVANAAGPAVKAP